MAKKNYTVTRKNSKMEPAHLRFQVALPTLSAGTPTSTSYLDISQIASLLNRRFYRQGLNWVVGSIKHMAVTNDGSLVNDGLVSVQKLPETWVMSNAWEKGFRSWMKMNKEALDENPSVKPKFLDFKIYADVEHHTAGFGANLLPVSGSGSLYVAGEWEPSKFHIPDTTGGATGDTREREVLATGASYPGAGASGFNAVSLIEGYASSRGLPNVIDPNVPDDAADADGTQPENWQAALFNEGTQQTDEVVSDMIAENNIAPYPFENDGVHLDTMYPGGANQAPGLVDHDFTYITGTTVGGESFLAPGCFPCGLMKVVTGATLTGESQLFQGLMIELVPGYHRGYLAEPMTEM